MSVKHEFGFEDVHDEECMQSQITVDCASQNLVPHQQSHCVDRCVHISSIKSIKMKKAIMQQVTELIRFVS